MAKGRVEGSVLCEAVFAAVVEGICDDRSSQQQMDAKRRERVQMNIQKIQKRKESSILQKATDGLASGVQESMHQCKKPIPKCPDDLSDNLEDEPEF